MTILSPLRTCRQVTRSQTEGKKGQKTWREEMAGCWVDTDHQCPPVHCCWDSIQFISGCPARVLCGSQSTRSVYILMVGHANSNVWKWRGNWSGANSTDSDKEKQAQRCRRRLSYPDPRRTVGNKARTGTAIFDETILDKLHALPIILRSQYHSIRKPGLVITRITFLCNHIHFPPACAGFMI